MREISKKGGYMKKTHMLSFIVLACLVALPVSSFALPIAGQGTYGSFTGSIEYYTGNSTEAKLMVNLTNTSKYVYLEGFSFSNPFIMGVWSEGTGSQVQDALSQDTPNGAVKVGFGLQNEVAIYLLLRGKNLDKIAAESLISNFVVYFSDGYKTSDQVSVSVSEPFTVILLGLGLVGLGIAARRKL
jgi:hypothetical protein